MKRKITTVFIIGAFIMCYSSLKAQNHPTNGLVEHFSFDNTLVGSYGTVLNANTSNFSAGYLGDANGAFNIENSFNKLKSDTIIDGFPSANSNFTVCFWLKLNTNTTASLFNYSGYDGDEISQNLYATGLAYDNNKLIISKAEMAIFTELNINYTYNSDWHHVALLHFGSLNYNELYIDGVYVDTKILILNTPSFSNSKLQIGQSPGGTHFGDFEMDEFLVYNRTLDAAELLSIASQTANINEFNSQSQLEIYPNPTNDIINLENLNAGSQITVYDVTGKVVYSEIVESTVSGISTSDWENGIYLVETSFNSIKQQTKLVVNK